MATLKEGVYSYLSSQTALTGTTGTRIYPGRAPQGAARPHIVFGIMGRDSNFGHAGGSSGLYDAILSIRSEGTSEKNAADVDELVRAEMDGFSGSMGSIKVRCCLLRDTRDTTQPPQQGDEVGYPSVTSIYYIVYTATKPTF